MVERRNASLDTTDETPQPAENVVLGETFLLFPPGSTTVTSDSETDGDSAEYLSSVTVIDPIDGYVLPLSVHAYHNLETAEPETNGLLGIDVQTKKLGFDMLTKKGKLRRRKVIPFIASLRLVITLGNTKREELVPQINDRVNGISFFLPNALREDERDEIGKVQGRLFSITAENR